ncbi:MAG: peptidoglycan-binding protein [Deltaproteobacteria bacterium]|nr:peptidoglycan-binding protein [Deltaproteobacteria bacterium]
MINYKVKQGDCLASIAEKHGFSWETLWNLPENNGLRRKHQEPTILLPDEIVRIPDRREKEENGATEQRHRFRKKGTPALLRLQVMRPAEPDEEQPSELTGEEAPEEEPLEVVEEDPPPPDAEADEPWADAPYVLNIDGRLTEGRTDGEGKLEVPIPPGARKGRLTMEPGTEREKVYPLRLGHLDPITSVSGVADRLNNLGYHNGSRPTEMTPDLREALRAFQKANNLRESGEADQATQDKLSEIHGS